MKAAIRRKYGSPETIQIEDIGIPTPSDNEVLIKVAATTVNRTDCANLTGKPFIMHFVLGFFKPGKIILGTDYAGTIVSTGKNVSSYKINDMVFGFKDTGLSSQAEYVTIPEKDLLLIPGNINFKQAAASLEGAHYAYTFIHKSPIQAGQKIFINGATGAIGSALLQFVKQFDVEIAASCNTKNINLIKSLGAQRVYDFTKEDFTKGNEKYDFIFDAVGKSSFGKCKPILNKGGVYISSELGAYGQNLFFAISTAIAGNKKVFFPAPYSKQKTMPYIIDLLKKGKYIPLIDRAYSLQDISKAYTYVMSGEKTGNVIIDMEI